MKKFKNMQDQPNIKKIKEFVEEFFEKMTFKCSEIEVKLNTSTTDQIENHKEIIDIVTKLDEPQILIGQQGQTLFEIQRILRLILNKQLYQTQNNKKEVTINSKILYLNLDINNYKNKKIEYLKTLAKELADQAVLDKNKKEFLPMSAYERRIIHTELSHRTDIITISRGEGTDRRVVVEPK